MNTPCSQLNASFTSGIVDGRRPPNKIADNGTPSGFCHSGSITGHCSAGAVKREFGCAPLLPLALLQTGPAAGPAEGLKRDWSAPALDVQKHYGYAGQWFVFAAMTVGLYAWFQLIRPRLRRR